MVIYDLICPGEHRFEAWFQNAVSFEEQQGARLIQCPHCGTTEIRRIPTGLHFKMSPCAATTPLPHPTTATHASPAKAAVTPEISVANNLDPVIIVKAVQKYVKENFKNVGPEFTEKAVKMHKGELSAEAIYGTANRDNLEQLDNEGISYMPLPKLPESFEN